MIKCMLKTVANPKDENAKLKFGVEELLCRLVSQIEGEI